jgi:hypothetical protein
MTTGPGKPRNRDRPPSGSTRVYARNGFTGREAAPAPRAAIPSLPIPFLPVQPLAPDDKTQLFQSPIACCYPTCGRRCISSSSIQLKVAGGPCPFTPSLAVTAPTPAPLLLPVACEAMENFSRACRLGAGKGATATAIAVTVAHAFMVIQLVPAALIRTERHRLLE